MRRYGLVIGFATRQINPGEHVHTHNLDAGEFERQYAFGVDVQPVEMLPESRWRTFFGYRRENGRVGTRNTIAVISNVNCSAHTVREIAHYFTPERLVDFPNVDGVIALTHSLGCAERIGGVGYQLLQRTLANMALHPNVGGYIMVGLGCEVNQIETIAANYDLQNVPGITIQESGGIRKTIASGIAAIEAMLPDVNQTPRHHRLHPHRHRLFVWHFGRGE